MGIFKIFRRKKTSGELLKDPSDDGGGTASRSKPAGSQNNLGKQAVSPASNGSGRPSPRSAVSTSTKNQGSLSNVPASNGGFGVRTAIKSEPGILPPNNQSGGPGSFSQNISGKNHASSLQQEFGLTQSGSAESSPRLSQQQLHRFDLQNSASGGNSRNHPTHGIGHAMFTMADMSPGQLDVMDDMDRSDASSSSFNLSTDAEDSEYETLRRRGVLPIARPRNNGDNSVLSAIAAPAPYSGNTEEERLYPSLRAADHIIAETKQKKTPEKEVAPVARRQPVPSVSTTTRPFAPIPPDEEPVRTLPQRRTSPSKQPQPLQPPTSQLNIYPVNNQAEDDLRAWGVSPSSSSNRDATSARSGPSQNSPLYSFENTTSPRNNEYGFAPRSGAGPVDPPASTTSPSSATRNLTSPKMRVSDTDAFSPDPDFADFVDFSSFGNNAFAATKSSRISDQTSPSSGWREEKKVQETPERPKTALEPMAYDEGFEITPSSGFDKKSNATNTSINYAHSSPGGTDNSLSELLAQAKNKQRRGNRVRSSRASSSSVNSAPAITAAFLRQHHNLGKYATSIESHDRSSSEGATSVSDIIQNLEATNLSRVKTGSRASHGHRSVGDAGVVSTARAVKERLREKRRKEREMGNSLNRSSEASSSDNSDNEASESWLFDEVTGALGPRGIAADLESLSGRSNRSKESRGNKSHVSRSRRLRSSGSRRAKSSGDSVDSRTSRYSHRSTKSFLSQMSEQSRSVANDLLRLEMQLAMVGNMDKQEDAPGRSGTTSGNAAVIGSANVGAVSRINRISTSGLAPRNSSGGTSRSPSRSSPVVSPSVSHATRNKINVLAPPGKLGIILANKADSKGTVVSGVRASSPLVDKIMPGDRIIAIDGEDVSRMSVSEITTIMSRKAEYDRTLTVLTIPKHLDQFGGGSGDATIPTPRGHPSGVGPSPSRSPSYGHTGTDVFDTMQFGQFRH